MAEKVEEYTTKTGVKQEIIRRDLSKLRDDAWMKNYDEYYKSFNWEDVKKEFSWYETKKVNMAYECIDRHCETGKKDKAALIYSSDEGTKKFTFEDIKRESNKFANVLKKYGIKKGDRVFIFMPRSPELYFTFMGILKIGAIAAPLFEAFMEEAVKDRVHDAEGVMIITTPALEGRVPFDDLPKLDHIVLVGEKKEGEELKTYEISYEKEMAGASEDCEIEWLGLEDPLILHYTSGSTGKPKGALHVQNAMIGHLHTGKVVLGLHEDDIYWCTADPGWVTGTSYGIFAPWLNGVTNLIQGGRFSADAWYTTLQDNKVTVWYSAPTAFRLLMAKGDVSKYDISSVRAIYSVGEPLNPEVIKWGLEAYGKTIMENWWMTECGMQLICNYPCLDLKPGSMGKATPGTYATIINDEGKELPAYEIGNLAVEAGWPSMMRKIWGNEEKYNSYFVEGDGKKWYVSGDSAYKDEEGYFFFQGRLDDVIKTAGERVGPFEVESALVEHPAVAEAGVIGKPDPIRGSIIKAFVTLKPGFEPSEKLKEEITLHVKTKLAAHAKPREIEFLDKLPKTRSGKIMRRVLKAKELGLPTGDLSTMADE